MKKGKKNRQQEDYLAANRRGSREAEIEMYGKPVNHHRVYVSKKVYNRKKNKADENRQPYSANIGCFYSATSLL